MTAIPMHDMPDMRPMVAARLTDMDRRLDHLEARLDQLATRLHTREDTTP